MLVKSIVNQDDYLIREDGEIFCIKQNRYLKQHLDSTGYFAVSYRYSKSNWERVHRIVAQAFLDNPENKKMVNHKDGVKTNNHVSNLEWSTCYENNKHARDTGLNKLTGENHPYSKLTELDVYVIRNSPLTCKELSVQFDTHIVNIQDVINGKTWTHLPLGCKKLKVHRPNMSESDKFAILELKKEGVSQTEIAKKLNITPSMVAKFLSKIAQTPFKNPLEKDCLSCN